MAAKNVTQVLIGGKIYTLSGYESEEYLQRVAAYLNNKINEMKTLGTYPRMSTEMRSLMLTLNIADDYFKMKKQADLQSSQASDRDKELYELKHELLTVKMEAEQLRAQLEEAKAQSAEAQE